MSMHFSIPATQSEYLLCCRSWHTNHTQTHGIFSVSSFRGISVCISLVVNNLVYFAFFQPPTWHQHVYKTDSWLYPADLNALFSSKIIRCYLGIIFFLQTAKFIPHMIHCFDLYFSGSSRLWLLIRKHAFCEAIGNCLDFLVQINSTMSAVIALK